MTSSPDPDPAPTGEKRRASAIPAWFVPVVFLLAAVGFMLSGNTALGAAFLTLGAAFTAIGQAKGKPGAVEDTGERDGS